MALQVGNKFVCAQAARDVHSSVVKDALHLLTLAGLVTPMKQTDGTGVPLGAEEDASYVKYLFFDLGIISKRSSRIRTNPRSRKKRTRRWKRCITI